MNNDELQNPRARTQGGGHSATKQPQFTFHRKISRLLSLLDLAAVAVTANVFFLLTLFGLRFSSRTHKRTEGRAPVWGSEFTSKDAALQGGRRNYC